jgi:hypothetical protein
VTNSDTAPGDAVLADAAATGYPDTFLGALRPDAGPGLE